MISVCLYCGFQARTMEESDQHNNDRPESCEKYEEES